MRKKFLTVTCSWILLIGCGGSSPGASDPKGEAPGNGGGAGTSTATGGSSASGGALGGTGGVYSGGSGGSGGTTSYLQWLTDAQCTWLARCDVFPSKAVCVQLYSARFINSPIATVQDAINAGRIQFTPNNTGACSGGMANLPCTSTGQAKAAASAAADPACLPALKGMVPAGSPCFTDLECTSTWCVTPSCSTACCQGVCSATPRVAGSPCNPDVDTCPSPLYCDDAISTCKSKVAAGSACLSWDACTDGLQCAGSSGAEKCVPYVADGQSCDNGNLECDNSNSFCDPADSLCKPLLKTGDPCTAGTTACPMYAICYGGVCTNLAKVGEPCISLTPAPGIGCMGGLCADGICTALPTPTPPASCY